MRRVQFAYASTVMRIATSANLSSQWIQSNQQTAIFDDFLVRYNPAYLHQLPHLVVLSVGAAVTSSLDTNTMERLAWLETVLTTVDHTVSLAKNISFQDTRFLVQYSVVN